MSGAFWTPERVGDALGPDAALRGDPAVFAFEAVQTDTRELADGALFVALRGERFDGHEFLAEAARAGAMGAVVDRAWWQEHGGNVPDLLACFVVPDTLAALGRLGNFRRRALDARVCAITGTNGKTSTKEMARAALSPRYTVHATTENLNNLVGTPLTLLSAPEGADALVVEIGTNAPGEIERLTDIVEPDVGIVTTVAEGHLEGLESLEGVLIEKTALVAGLGPDGLALVGEEPASLPERARALHPRVMVAGWTPRADAALRAEDVRLDEEGRPHFRWRGHEVRLQFRGRHHVPNGLLALGLAAEWGVPEADAVRALGEQASFRMRTELRQAGTLRVLVDCYNANPASTEAAVDLLTALPRGSGRVAVVGSMLELGRDSAALHERTAHALAERDLDLIVATGEFASAFASLEGALGERLVRVPDPEDAAAVLEERLRGGEVVLLKGSRGVALERLLPALESLGGAEGEGG
ncbi:MAG TPA: UDP-N-acetylmuramoyl-tripeptide--D-alanyl-D-alanine ligase [Longimicrobiales bacterium]|nr:UDP-N-acetylmuramoyl-tripeptide--D-alanyl-D-alanine ligase [Longimicrobiales bacterium]